MSDGRLACTTYYDMHYICNLQDLFVSCELLQFAICLHSNFIVFVDCNHATYIASAWLTKVNGMFACRVPFALLQCHDDIESTCAGRTCNHTCCEASRKPRNHYRTQISGKYWLTSVSPLSVPIENCPTSYKIAKLVACIPGSTGKWSMDTVFRPMPRAWAGWPSD